MESKPDTGKIEKVQALSASVDGLIVAIASVLNEAVKTNDAELYKVCQRYLGPIGQLGVDVDEYKEKNNGN